MKESLKKMSLRDAPTTARLESGKSVEEIAAEMNWSPSNANRIFYEDSYWPTLPSIPKLCVVLNNSIILEWLTVQAETGGLKFDFEAVDCIDLLRKLNVLTREMGEVAREAEKAVEDGMIDQAEARRISRELRDVLVRGVDLLGGLNAVR